MRKPFTWRSGGGGRGDGRSPYGGRADAGMADRSMADRGMATAELAACLPVLAIVVLVGLSAISVADQRVRAQDAASEVARAVARGDTATAARLFAETAPNGAVYTVRTDGGQVTVTVRVTLHPAGGRFGDYALTAQAVAAAEPDLGPPATP
jgi:hypothetical protein